MLIKHLSALAIASAAGLIVTMSAEASPRFTIHNDADSDVKVIIFAGNDSDCLFEEKVKTVSSGKSNTVGCSGHGKGRCKVRVKWKGEEVCKKNWNTCGNEATKINDGGDLYISLDNKDMVCTFAD